MRTTYSWCGLSGRKSLLKTNLTGVPSLTSPPPWLLFFQAPFYFAPLPTIWTPETGYVQQQVRTLPPWWTKEPPMTHSPDRWSWSTITEAWTKIQKSCWKFSRSSLKYDSASVIWWSELKIYGEQGQIKELSLKNKRRV